MDGCRVDIGQYWQIKKARSRHKVEINKIIKLKKTAWSRYIWPHVDSPVCWKELIKKMSLHSPTPFPPKWLHAIVQQKRPILPLEYCSLACHGFNFQFRHVNGCSKANKWKGKWNSGKLSYTNRLIICMGHHKELWRFQYYLFCIVMSFLTSPSYGTKF